MNCKYLIIVLVFLFSVTETLCQRVERSELPKTVEEAFKKTHPGDFPYEWKYVKKKAAYKAYFVSDGRKYKSYFKPDGEWLYAKTKMPKEELPEEIWKHYHESEWMDWKLKKTQLRLTPEEGEVYILNVKRGKKKYKEKVKLYYNKKGSFMKHEKSIKP